MESVGLKSVQSMIGRKATLSGSFLFRRRRSAHAWKWELIGAGGWSTRVNGSAWQAKLAACGCPPWPGGHGMSQTLCIIGVSSLQGGQLDRETSLVAFSYIVYFVHCAFFNVVWK